ncbi:MAG TPA: hypothetical protein VH482_00795 [Thermomicrobiales bacterium]|jgi:hypothetical protein
MTEIGATSAPGLNRPGLLTAMKVASSLFAALVLLQAIIAGRGWFKDFDLIKTHGQIGSFVLLVAIVQAVLAFMVFGSRSRLALVGAVLVVLTAIQLSLGYSSRDSSTAASLHIPNGVLIFGIATAFASSVLRVGGAADERAGSR